MGKYADRRKAHRGPLRRRAAYWAARAVATVIFTPLHLLGVALTRGTDVAVESVQALEVWAYPGLFADPRLPAPELGEDWKARMPAR